MRDVQSVTTATAPATRALTPKQAAFVAEYLVDLNATQAAIRAGYSAKTATVTGAKLLANAKVSAAIAEAQAARAERTGITQDAVLARWWDLATADPRDLVEYRRTACRCCYGPEFTPQRTPDEHRQEAVVRADATPPAPDTIWPKNREPNPACPECFGDGVERVFVRDTRTLTPAAARLYAGVKQTKDGIEVKMRDQDAALLNVAKHLGMFVEKRELTGKDGAPLIPDRDFDEMSDADLAALAARLATATP